MFGHDISIIVQLYCFVESYLFMCGKKLVLLSHHFLQYFKTTNFRDFGVNKNIFYGSKIRFVVQLLAVYVTYYQLKLHICDVQSYLLLKLFALNNEDQQQFCSRLLMHRYTMEYYRMFLLSLHVSFQHYKSRRVRTG